MYNFYEGIRTNLRKIFIKSKSKYLSDSDITFYLYLINYCDQGKGYKVLINAPFHVAALNCSKRHFYRKLELLVEIKAIKKHHKNGSALYIEILQPKVLLALHGMNLTTQRESKRHVVSLVSEEIKEFGSV